MDPLSPLEPPPPAYSEEQQALDRKISDALEQSLRITQPSSTEQDTWEEWDDAKFEAAARHVHERAASPPHRSSEKDRLAREDADRAHLAVAVAPPGASSSSRPHVNTGSLGRRLPASPPANTSTKERPSWFAQAQLDRDPPPTTQLHHIPPEEPSPDEQLPAFTAVGPSLEGPPFEDVVRVQHRTNVVAGDSPPQSPLDSVDGGSTSSPSPPAWAPLRPAPRGSYFPDHPPRTPPPRVPQTAHTSSGAASPRPPRPPPIPFDHSMAYVKPHTVVRDVRENNTDSPTGAVDASAFYNSAVSSLFNGPSSRSQLPKKTDPLNRGPLSGSTGPDAGSYSSHTSDARASSGSHAPIPSPNSGHESFPPQGNVYGSYSPQPSTYPPQQPSYPPSQPSYPQQHASYPQPQPPYPQQHASYPQQHASYPLHQQASYPSPPQSSYTPQHQPYPPQQPQYAPQHQQYYQGYNAPVVAQGPPAQVPWTPYRDQYGSGPGHGR